MFLNNIKLLSIMIGNSGLKQSQAAKPKFKVALFLVNPQAVILKKKMQKLNVKYQNKIKKFVWYTP